MSDIFKNPKAPPKPKVNPFTASKLWDMTHFARDEHASGVRDRQGAIGQSFELPAHSTGAQQTPQRGIPYSNEERI